ncbi:ABC transporter permease subunit [Pseudomonas sp. Z1-14]|uniref:ABC transporter permease subunit n=1 Tax=Pseudomonas sp. Z1-14 TaxID=2817409 RepID=UPI003DA9D80A
MSEWEILWQSRDIFLKGLLNTIVLFLFSFSSAFVIGCIANYWLERGSLPRLLVKSYMNTMRTVPFLVLVCLIYYGLPQLGLRVVAWLSGVVGLAIYHGAYFAEILRGPRLIVPQGQLDAALAYGFPP